VGTVPKRVDRFNDIAVSVIFVIGCVPIFVRYGSYLSVRVILEIIGIPKRIRNGNGSSKVVVRVYGFTWLR
jgi:hypothetical protein